MAKKNDAAYEAFLADLKAINPNIEEILKDDRVSGKLREGVLARSDYSAKMDEMNNYLAQEKAKIEGWHTWYGNATQQFQSQQDKLNQYIEEFGELEPGQQRRVAKEQGMTPEQFQKALNEELQKREVAFMKFADDLTDIKMQHEKKFNEKLNIEDVYKVAGEQQLPLNVAYKTYIADRVEELNQKAVEERIKSAREEGYKEAISKHNLPVLDNTSPVHVLDAQESVGKNDRERVAAAVKGFMSLKN